jgi:hypothetical protein
MRVIKQITNNKFLNIKEVSDPNMGCKGYQFAERRGVDSIAFICYDKSTNKFLLNNEATPPLGIFLLRAFGGSLDKDILKDEIVKEEVLEEAGYDVDLKNIKSVGKCFVSTQMNQYCHLYFVMVSDKQKTERKPENACEALAETVWLSEEEIVYGDDWKAIAILNKAKRRAIIQ